MSFITSSPRAAYGMSAYNKVMAILDARTEHRKNRRDYRKLIQMSDRDLDDMGLTRNAVLFELQRPFRRRRET